MVLTTNKFVLSLLNITTNGAMYYWVCTVNITLNGEKYIILLQLMLNIFANGVHLLIYYCFHEHLNQMMNYE